MGRIALIMVIAAGMGTERLAAWKCVTLSNVSAGYESKGETHAATAKSAALSFIEVSITVNTGRLEVDSPRDRRDPG